MKRMPELFIAVFFLVLMAVAVVGAQDQDPKDARIAELERQIAAKVAEKTPAQWKASYAAVYTQARERGEAGCKAAGGKKFIVTIDSAGKPGSSCEF